MSERLPTKQCVQCGSFIPVDAAMCAGCGTSDPDGLRAAGGPPRRVSVIAGPTTITSIIVWSNIAYLLFTLYVQFRIHPDQGVLQSLISMSGLHHALGPAGWYSHPAVFEGGEWWRTITAMYLHAGLIHIGFNMFAMRNLGRVVEQLIGPWRLIVLYTLSGVGSTLAISFWATWGSGDPRIPMVGASGAVFGVAGALAVFALRSGTMRGRQMGRMLVRDIALMLVLGWWIRFISNTGHVGGLVVGVMIALGLGDSFRDRIDPERENLWRGAALVCVAVTAIALGYGVWNAFTTTGGG